MEIDKENQMPTIDDEEIKKVLKAFKLSYKKEGEKYEEENIKIEDVVNLTKGFSGKSAILATTVIISVMIAMPPKEFMALMDTVKSISKAKFLEAIKEILKEKVKKGADNDIYN